MIEIQATTRRTFLFPAPMARAQEFFSDFRRMVGFLRYISLVQARDNQHFRILYSTTEAGAYSIQIFADVETEFASDQRVLYVRPTYDIEPVSARVGLRSLSAQGIYSSQSVFHPEGDQTRIDYHVQLAAELPAPLGLSLIPDSVLNHVADGTTRRRMNEIIDGFIARSITAYPQWLASLHEHAG